MGFGTGGGAGMGRGKFSGKKCRLISMFGLTSVFFLLEIVTGYVTNSMALVADSFHMLSDIAALVIAFISVRMAPKSWSKNTFGWARAEVLGALVNAVFLVALCFSITVESMKRFYEPEEIHNPVMILYVGGMGLAVNLVGLCLFHEHGSSHGHSHGLTRSTHSHLTDLADREEKDAENSEIYPRAGESHGHSHSAMNMNMRGVFLHVMADALGSVVVIISAIIMWQTDWEYKLYVDPGLSLLLVILILRSVWPLLIDSALILLQTVPTHIQVDTLQRKLMEKVDGILAVHEFHVWQLTGDRIIASAHIRCLNLAQYMEVAEKVKEFFHHEGIHSTTIQPEFVEMAPNTKLASTEDCVLACPKLPKNSFAGCEASKCCPPGSKAPSAGSQSRSSRSSSPLNNRRPSSISISAETAKEYFDSV
jgi:zinc transporter 1